MQGYPRGVGLESGGRGRGCVSQPPPLPPITLPSRPFPASFTESRARSPQSYSSTAFAAYPAQGDESTTNVAAVCLGQQTGPGIVASSVHERSCSQVSLMHQPFTTPKLPRNAPPQRCIDSSTSQFTTPSTHLHSFGPPYERLVRGLPPPSDKFVVSPSPDTWVSAPPTAQSTLSLPSGPSPLSKTPCQSPASSLHRLPPSNHQSPLLRPSGALFSPAVQSCAAALTHHLSPSGTGEDRHQKWLDNWAASISVCERLREYTNKQRRRFCSLSEGARDADSDTARAAIVRRSVARRRRSHAARAANRRHQRQRLQQLHADIDARRLQHSQHSVESQQNNGLTLQTKQSLKDVSSKIADINRYIQLVECLTTLREIRDRKARQRAHFSSSESDELFSERCNQLTALLDSRLCWHEQQQQCLQQTLTSTATATEQNKNTVTQSGEQWASRVLFGEAVSRPDTTTSSSLPPHWPQDLASLVDIRRDWDVLIVDAGDQLVSAVPPYWVCPVAPSSDDWRKFVTHDTRRQ